MSENDHKKLSEISASQWGLITTGQAGQAGVSRLKLSRLVRANQFIRLAHGIYRDAGAVESGNEAIKAAWLSAQPILLASERLQSPAIIVGGATASYLCGCGDLDPFPYQFYVNYRKQTQRPELSYIKKAFSSEDYLLTDGLPVARIEYAMTGLIGAGYDISLIAKILRDARASIGVESPGKVRFDQAYFIRCLNTVARKAGSKSGEALYESLLVEIGEGTDDYKRLLEAVLDTSPVSRELSQQVTGKVLENLPELNDTIREITDNLVSTIDLTPAAKAIQTHININALEALRTSLIKSLKYAVPEIDSQALRALSGLSRHGEQEDTHD